VLLLSVIRVNDPSATPSSAAASATKAIDRPSIKRIQSYLSWIRLQAYFIGSLFRGQDNFRWIEFRGMIEPIFRGYIGKAPIHHSDARGKPKEEHDAKSDSNPSMEENQKSQNVFHGTFLFVYRPLKAKALRAELKAEMKP